MNRLELIFSREKEIKGEPSNARLVRGEPYAYCSADCADKHLDELMHQWFKLGTY